MHIPDGFLDAKVALAAGAMSAIGVGFSLREVHKNLPPRKIPLLGLSAAFVFAAQMLNFPVAGGTSGHLIGGVLTAVLLGPCAATVVLTAVLLVQCFMFADGGVTALGANIFNMGIVAPMTGYILYRLARRFVPGERGLVLGVAFASWVSTVLAAIVCAGQLALSGTVAWSVAFPAMTDVHMLIGVGEGLITSLVVIAIVRTRPDLIEDNAVIPQQWQLKTVMVYGLLVSFGLALFVSPFACSWPDGLDHVAAKLGFEHQAAAAGHITTPMPDYRLPGIQSPLVGTAFAGVIGTFIAFGLALILARVLVPKTVVEKQ
jgi:cobalt/nickel transport system permease protein